MRAARRAAQAAQAAADANPEAPEAPSSDSEAFWQEACRLGANLRYHEFVKLAQLGFGKWLDASKRRRYGLK